MLEKSGRTSFLTNSSQCKRSSSVIFLEEVKIEDIKLFSLFKFSSNSNRLVKDEIFKLSSILALDISFLIYNILSSLSIELI